MEKASKYLKLVHIVWERKKFRVYLQSYLIRPELFKAELLVQWIFDSCGESEIFWEECRVCAIIPHVADEPPLVIEGAGWKFWLPVNVFTLFDFLEPRVAPMTMPLKVWRLILPG